MLIAGQNLTLRCSSVDGSGFRCQNRVFHPSHDRLVKFRLTFIHRKYKFQLYPGVCESISYFIDIVCYFNSISNCVKGADNFIIVFLIVARIVVAIPRRRTVGDFGDRKVVTKA